MADLYKGTPASFGGFPHIAPGGSSSKGYYQQPLNLPFHEGRSILATIPEYQRNPFQLEKDLMFKISEGRNNLMKIILEQAELGGGIEVNDVRFRLPIEVEPNQRLYLGLASSNITTNSAGLSTFSIKGNTTKISTAHPQGNIKQVGDIARLEVGQFVMLMFSWVTPKRETAGASAVVYAPNALGANPIPEIAKVVSIDYANNKVTVERNWAGEQRATGYSYANFPAFQVTANPSVWTPGSVAINEKFAFLMPMAKSMREDEIDAKIRNFSGTWTYGILQRHLLAWGSQHFAEVISGNMGIQSPLTKSKRYALKDYYDHWELQALFGEKSESFDPETGYWAGTTDGLLTNIPKSHYVGIKGIDYASGFTAGSSINMGSFHPLIFNKLIENMGYMGSSEKILVCGSAFHTAFSTMINHMTQAVPDIKSTWNVEGKQFKSSNGLTINVIPSDKMSLNGMSHSAVLYDKQYFKPIKLRNYPGADIFEIKNENPLKTNGFIHGVKGFIDLNPDAHWVLTVVEKTLADGTDNTTAYGNTLALGSYL